MKKSGKTRPRRHSAPKLEKLPAPKRDRDPLTMTKRFLELYPMNQIIENSYVLSRFWAWFSQVQTTPQLHIPVPRFLTYRDP